MKRTRSKNFAVDVPCGNEKNIVTRTWFYTHKVARTYAEYVNGRLRVKITQITPDHKPVTETVSV
jgi:hypothetical protein